MRSVLVAIGFVGIVASTQPAPAAPFQVHYAANLNGGESYINITNAGANGATVLAAAIGEAAGNICVNVYALSRDAQLISYCSCLLTPNGLVNLGVVRDLTSKTVTGVAPTTTVAGGRACASSPNSPATVNTAGALGAGRM